MVSNTEPHRLLHIFSTFAVGGPQVRFCAIANSLGTCYHHTILAMDGDFDCASRIAPGVLWDKFTIPAIAARGISLRNLYRFRQALTATRPEAVLTYNWGAVEWALANRWWPRAPHLHFEDGFGPDENPDRQLVRRVYLRRVALGGGTRVIVPSRTLWKVASSRWGVGEDRLFLIPNGVDCERFVQTGDRSLLRRFRIDPEELIIGTVTALRPEKNIGRLITAFAQLGSSNRARLIIVGDGSERSRLQQLAAVSGAASRIHFIGSVLDPAAVYECLDVFAMSSDTEQMPIALLEAMASSLAVVSTDVGDIATIVASENRPFIEGCRDSEALARNLMMLASDAGLRKKLGSRNRTRACSDFGLPLMLMRHKELLDRTLPTARLRLCSGGKGAAQRFS